MIITRERLSGRLPGYRLFTVGCSVDVARLRCQDWAASAKRHADHHSIRAMSKPGASRAPGARPSRARGVSHAAHCYLSLCVKPFVVPGPVAVRKPGMTCGLKTALQMKKEYSSYWSCSSCRSWSALSSYRLDVSARCSIRQGWLPSQTGGDEATAETNTLEITPELKVIGWNGLK